MSQEGRKYLSRTVTMAQVCGDLFVQHEADELGKPVSKCHHFYNTWMS